jgi:hypothetical protein
VQISSAQDFRSQIDPKSITEDDIAAVKEFPEPGQFISQIQGIDIHIIEYLMVAIYYVKNNPVENVFNGYRMNVRP